MTAVICAYTEARWEMLLSSVASVKLQAVPPLEILVCIDHNEGLYKKCVAHFEQPDHRSVVPVRVLRNRYDGHLGSARTTAAQAASGEILAFLDDDASADPHWLSHLLDVYRDPDVGAVGGRAIPEFESERPPWFPFEYDWVFGCSYAGMPTRRAPLGHLIGASMSVHRHALEQIGYFHSDDHDDMDMCHRVAHLMGPSAVVYEPAAFVKHFVPVDHAPLRAGAPPAVLHRRGGPQPPRRGGRR
ncbi:MAG: glycosyltransferase family 2 protein, partial [Acidimicrobiales bacterium]